jgi:four helix bundle protein
MLNQISNLKNQNDKAKFKKLFIKRLIVLALNVLRLCDELRRDRRGWTLSDQLTRSITSIGSNVVEGSASSSKKEYVRFFGIALKSANESKFWLFLVQHEFGQIESRATELLAEVGEVANILGASIITMKGKRRGSGSSALDF